MVTLVSPWRSTYTTQKTLRDLHVLRTNPSAPQADYNYTVRKSVTYTKERPLVAARSAPSAWGLHLGGTQWMSLSAANVRNRCSKLHVVHKRIVPIMECDCICTRRTAQVQTK